MKLIRTLSLVLAMTATASVAPAFADAPADADVAKFLAFFDKLVDTANADKASCPKMATDINALLDDNKDLLALAKQARSQGKQLKPADRDKMVNSMKRMAPAMQACGKDPKVSAAFQRLEMH